MWVTSEEKKVKLGKKEFDFGAAESKENSKLTSKIINIIRTTQRNNIELTSIADGKANVLLSLNAIMLTGLVPWILSNIDYIVSNFLYIPLIILMITCFLTIYQATEVLKPSDFDQKRHGITPDVKPSPFFFGNFYKMESRQYYDYLREGLARDDLVRAHLAQDLFYVGRRLGIKMHKIRTAFNIFLLGIFSTLVTTVLALLIQ